MSTLNESSPALLHEVMQAHGGFALWNEAKRVRAVMSTGGALFLMRTTRGVFRRTEVLADLHRPYVELRDFPRPGMHGVFDGDLVTISDASGAVIAKRENARDHFAGLAKQLHWDNLNAVYFAGYAVWNYLTTPFLFCNDALAVTEGDPWVDHGESRRTLDAEFPNSVPTHNSKQSFHFDDRSYLRRHDYCPDVIGPYAVAAHYCDDHREFGGAVFPTRRVVLPRTGGGTVMPFPKLVWIDVHEVALES